MSPDELTTRLEAVHQDAFGWALRCCGGDRSAAEETLQASYLKILDGRARFDGRASFRTWVFAVIRRTAAEERRRRALWRWLPLDGDDDRREPVDHRLDPATRAARADEADRLESALGRLPRRQQEVLHLVFYQDLTIAEAAALLGIGLGSARTHYERGKAALRRLLREGDG